MKRPTLPPCRLLFAACCLAVFTGCESVNTVQPSKPVAQPNIVDDQRITTDPTLAYNIRITAINETRLDNGRLKVQAQLRNADRQAHTIHYRFEWIDHEGMVQPSITSSWRSTTLQGGQTQFVAGTAPHRDAADFRLELIERKPHDLLQNR